MIDEFEPRKPGAHQLKYYARGVGPIRTGWRGSDADHEVLVLAKLEHLSPEKLAAARRAAARPRAHPRPLMTASLQILRHAQDGALGLPPLGIE